MQRLLLLLLALQIGALWGLTPPAHAKPVPAAKVVLEEEPSAEAGGIVETEDGIIETESDATITETESSGIVEHERPEVAPDATLILKFEGTRADTIRERVRKALTKDGIAMAPEDLQGDRKFAGAPGEYVVFGQETGVRAFIQGTVTGTSKNWSVALTVRSAKTGGVVGEAELSAKNLPALLREIDEKATEVLGTPLSKTERAPSPKPAPTVELAPDFSADGEDDADDGKLPSPLELNLGVAFMVRNLSYTDPLADAYNFPLVPHENVGLVAPVGELRWYPGAHILRGVIAHIGIDVAFRRSLIGNTVAFGADFPTTFTEFLFGIRGRFPLKRGELGVYAGLGSQSLEIQDDNKQPAGATEGDPGIVPDVSYGLTRFGFDAKLPLFDKFTAEPGLYVRLVNFGDTQAGQLTEPRWFPNATADGVDARVAVAWQWSETISFKAGIDYRRYGLQMNTDSASSFEVNSTTNLQNAVAGGAVDSYVGGFLLASYTLPGKSHSAVGDDQAQGQKDDNPDPGEGAEDPMMDFQMEE
jgi:hypothetical protein